MRRLLVPACAIAIMIPSPSAAGSDACDPSSKPKTIEQTHRCVVNKANQRDDQSYWSLAVAGGIAAVAAMPIAYLFLRRGARKRAELEAEALGEDEAWKRELGEDDISPAPG